MSVKSKLEDKTVGRDVSNQALTISGVTDFDSPETASNDMLFLSFQRRSQPFDALKSSVFNSLTKTTSIMEDDYGTL